jgi:hypothetical protein
MNWLKPNSDSDSGEDQNHPDPARARFLVQKEKDERDFAPTKLYIKRMLEEVDSDDDNVLHEVSHFCPA